MKKIYYICNLQAAKGHLGNYEGRMQDASSKALN